MFLQVILQTILVEAVYAGFVILLLSFNLIHEDKTYYKYYSIGWDPIIILWAFKYTHESPDEQISFCFLPCLLRRKYIPIIISLFFFVMSIGNFHTALIIPVALVIGILQSMAFKWNFTALPFCVYSVLDRIIPNFIKNRVDFITVESVQGDLSKECYCAGVKKNREGI